MTAPEPSADVRMLPGKLATRAMQTPDAICLIEAETEQSLTYAELYAEARRLAAELRGLGVAPGSAVATMLPHSLDTYRTWFACAALGALEVPIGTRYRGHRLAQIINDSAATVLVVERAFVDDIASLRYEGRLPALRTVVVRGGGEVSGLGDLTVLNFDELVAGGSAAPLSHDEDLLGVQASDLALVLYTSGTTGPSKGVLVPWGQVHATTLGLFPAGTFGPDKVIYGPFPPNHIGGRLFPCLGLEHGAPVVIRHTFSASAFWKDIEKYRCTTTALVSAMASILWSAPKADTDAENCLEDVVMVPLIPEWDRFQTRFGVRLCTDFNMTETSIPTHSGWDIRDWRSCGKVRPGYPYYELRVVDADDNPLGPGEVGELVCRTGAPWTMNAGYLGRPDETAAAWRNGWFHTGDAFRYDDEGYFYFVDRTKDAIRRRGENVSSFEVEREVLDHPDVLDCAAIGVPSEVSEEDIKVFVVKRSGSALTEAMVIEHVASKAANFMVPRYVEFLAELPVTEGTNKVRKAELRSLEARRAAESASTTTTGDAPGLEHS
ncbi:MAG: AMP-binding protein [Marmoricola sp.]